MDHKCRVLVYAVTWKNDKGETCVMMMCGKCLKSALTDFWEFKTSGNIKMPTIGDLTTESFLGLPRWEQGDYNWDLELKPLKYSKIFDLHPYLFYDKNGNPDLLKSLDAINAQLKERGATFSIDEGDVKKIFEQIAKGDIYAYFGVIDYWE
jgi:hypothetical protein